VTFLGPRARRRGPRAREVDRFSLAAMFTLAGLCLFAGILPRLALELPVAA